MAPVYKYYDPEGFLNQPVYNKVTDVPVIRVAVRRSILAANLLTYLPAVVILVLLNSRKQSKLLKYSTMLAFLIFPAYAFIEYACVQANGPHLMLLLLSMHFVVNDKPFFATFCFTLCCFYKHVAIQLVFPIAIFIMARYWNKLTIAGYSVTHIFKK